MSYAARLGAAFIPSFFLGSFQEVLHAVDARCLVSMPPEQNLVRIRIQRTESLSAHPPTLQGLIARSPGWVEGKLNSLGSFTTETSAAAIAALKLPIRYSATESVL